MKIRKASRPNNVLAEIWNNFEETLINMLWNLMNKIFIEKKINR